MKKNIIFFIVLAFFLNFYNIQISSANQKSTFYAKVENDNIYFYSEPIDDQTSKLFILPKSYFVLLTDNANETFYYAQYKDLYGYVKKNEVVPMNGIPQTPYASANFTIMDLDGLAMYATPKFTNNNALTNIEYQTIISTYYGQMYGENIPDLNEPWYYCKYNKDGTDLYGYVYSTFCYKESSIQTNNESFEIITSPIFETSIESDTPLSEVAMAFIVIGVSLPCLLIIYLLIKPSLQKNGITPKKKIKKRHGDYFEFDENDLN